MDKNAMFREFLENISDMDPELIDNIQDAFSAVYESEEAAVDEDEYTEEDFAEDLEKSEDAIEAAEAAAASDEEDPGMLSDDELYAHESEYVATHDAHGKYTDIINATNAVLMEVLRIIREMPKAGIEPWTEVVSEKLFTALTAPTETVTDEQAEAMRQRIDAKVQGSEHSRKEYETTLAKGPNKYTISVKLVK